MNGSQPTENETIASQAKFEKFGKGLEYIQQHVLNQKKVN